MHLFLSMLLWGCGSPSSTEAIRMPPSVASTAEAPPTQAATDAPPREADPVDEPSAPEADTRWPPVEPPEGHRERDWAWAFQHKGTTKRLRERQAEEREELSADELEAIELGKMEPPEWLLALQDGEPKAD
jgi:hypothetical protein